VSAGRDEPTAQAGGSEVPRRLSGASSPAAASAVRLAARFRPPLPPRQPARCDPVPATAGTPTHRAGRSLPEPGPARDSRAASDTWDARYRFPLLSPEKSRTYVNLCRLHAVVCGADSHRAGASWSLGDCGIPPGCRSMLERHVHWIV